MGIFKAYDIRGVYPTELNEDIAYKIGRAFVVYTKAKQVLVGRDSRLSSQPLKEAMVKGIVDQGADVVDIGLATTPMTNFLHAQYNYETSMQITASHNPKEYGGCKMNTRDAEPLTGDEGIPEIRALVEKNIFSDAETKGVITKKDHISEYVEFLVGLVKEDITQLHVVVDASNGPVGKIAEKVFEKLGVQFVELNFEPDGNFPGHDPNPLKGDSQVQAKKLVAEARADFGCLFDADADRIIFIDEESQTVKPDLVAAMLSGELLKESPGDKIIVDCFSSHVVKEAIEKAGGKPIIMRTGRSFIYQQAKQEDVLFAAEASSHYYHREVYHGDNGLLTLLKVMEIVVKEKKHLSKIVKPFDTYHDTNQINVPVAGDAKEAVKKVADDFKDYEQNDMDGVSVFLNDEYETWFIVRPSNTEPLIRLRVEGKNAEKVDELKEKIMGLVAQ